MNKSKADLGVICNLLIPLLPELDKTIKHQMLSLISLVISSMFVLMQFVPVASASGPVSYIINKTVIDVAREGPLGNVTNAGDVINSDGIADLNQANPVYTYSTEGTYTVNLTAINANGITSKITPITVLKATISSSSGDSSGSSHSSSSGVIVGSSTVSSTHKTNATGNTTLRQTQNNTYAGQNDEDTANIEQVPEQKSTTDTPAKESKETPGFEIIYGITGLLAIFIIRRE